MAELFETFDDRGRPMGLVPREQVHARGLWHRAAHVFLFDARGALYVQRRAAGKDLYPNLWDFSVGEHLTPGETFLEGALRGLSEELGVAGVALTPIDDVHRATFHIPELGVVDRELQQTFRGAHDGDIDPDPVEVAAVEAVPLPALAAWIGDSPDEFTPWFSRALRALRMLPSSS